MVASFDGSTIRSLTQAWQAMHRLQETTRGNDVLSCNLSELKELLSNKVAEGFSSCRVQDNQVNGPLFGATDASSYTANLREVGLFNLQAGLQDSLNGYFLAQDKRAEGSGTGTPVSTPVLRFGAKEAQYIMDQHAMLDPSNCAGADASSLSSDGESSGTAHAEPESGSAHGTRNHSARNSCDGIGSELGGDNLRAKDAMLDQAQRLCLELQQELLTAKRDLDSKTKEAADKAKLCTNLQNEVKSLNVQLGERDYENSMLKENWMREKVDLLKEIQLLEVELANTRMQQEGMANYIRTHRIDQLPGLEAQLGSARQQLEKVDTDRQLYEDQLVRFKDQMSRAVEHYITERDRFAAQVTLQQDEIHALKDAIQMLQCTPKMGAPRMGPPPQLRAKPNGAAPGSLSQQQQPPPPPGLSQSQQHAVQQLAAQQMLVIPPDLLPMFGTGKLTCYHCKSLTHNWSKCEQLSTLREEAKQHLIEQYKKLTDAEKKLEKERKRQHRGGGDGRRNPMGPLPFYL